MDSLPDPSRMTDQDLIDEWFWLIADAENREDRTNALAVEMDKRGIDR
jgi:hypothetical protein